MHPHISRPGLDVGTETGHPTACSSSRIGSVSKLRTAEPGYGRWNHTRGRVPTGAREVAIAGARVDSQFPGGTNMVAHRRSGTDGVGHGDAQVVYSRSPRRAWRLAREVWIAAAARPLGPRPAPPHLHLRTEQSYAHSSPFLTTESHRETLHPPETMAMRQSAA